MISENKSKLFCFLAALKVALNVDSSGMNLLTNQMSSLGQQQQQQQQQLQFGNVSGATPTQPMSTPLRPPTVNPTPFCSPTGYGLFGSGNVSRITLFSIRIYAGLKIDN